MDEEGPLIMLFRNLRKQERLFESLDQYNAAGFALTWEDRSHLVRE